jgi:hypothetical protein
MSPGCCRAAEAASGCDSIELSEGSPSVIHLLSGCLTEGETPPIRRRARRSRRRNQPVVLALISASARGMPTLLVLSLGYLFMICSNFKRDSFHRNGEYVFAKHGG